MADHDRWMKFYVDDYFGATRLLTTEEHGAYMLLILEAFKRGGELPNDPETLRAMAAGPKPDRWRRIWGKIGHYFQLEKNGTVLVQRRAKKEAELARERVENSRKAGEASVEKRKRKSPESHETGSTAVGLALNGRSTDAPTETKVGVAIPLERSESEVEREREKRRDPEPPAGAVDPLTPYGLVTVVTAAINRNRTNLGLYNPGVWAYPTAQKFVEAIPPDQRNDITRADIRARAEAFAKCEDPRITKGTWHVQQFCENFARFAKGATEGPPRPESSAVAASRRLAAVARYGS